MRTRSTAHQGIRRAKFHRAWIWRAALCGLCGASVVHARPVRVVSINPCLDAILMEVADPAQIAGISHYSHDPAATSIPLAQAMRFRATSGTAEEVMGLSPDLVMAGGHVSPATVNALERLHIPLLRLGVPETIAESFAQIREVAAVMGHPERGEASVVRIESAVRAARPTDRRRIPALIWQNGGLVPGQGTLASQLLTLAGFENLSATYGVTKWDVLPLEYLMAQPPALLLSAQSTGPQRDRMLSHPAIARLGRRIAIRPYSFQLLQCAGPTIAAAMARLAELRRSVTRALAAK